MDRLSAVHMRKQEGYSPFFSKSNAVLLTAGNLDNLLVFQVPYKHYKARYGVSMTIHSTDDSDLQGSVSASNITFPLVTMCSPVLPFPN